MAASTIRLTTTAPTRRCAACCFRLSKCLAAPAGIPSRWTCTRIGWRRPVRDDHAKLADVADDRTIEPAVEEVPMTNTLTACGRDLGDCDRRADRCAGALYRLRDRRRRLPHRARRVCVL